MLFSRAAVAFSIIFVCYGGRNLGASGTMEHEGSSQDDPASNFLIGTGIYDMTGPAAQINFMGYARAGQTAHGIHQRLRSRAFIMAEIPLEGVYTPGQEDGISLERRETEEDLKQGRGLLRWRHKHREPILRKNSVAASADPDKTVCFVSIDAGMGSDLLNLRVQRRLEGLLPVQGDTGKRLCRLENLSISGTHTHSAPAGFLQYTLYQITSYGFSEEVMSAYVEGVAQSILRAYDKLQRGTIQTASRLLRDANINRSPSSYLLNPQSERDEYVDEGDTDKTMLMLKFASDGGAPLGALNWFAVHGTSMNSTNQLISGDNKGYASYLMEKWFNGEGALPGKGDFVAAFASTNLGDVSPNTAGPTCLDTGRPCDFVTSTCNSKMTLCVAHGPGNDMFESTEIIGRSQFENAISLYEEESPKLYGAVAFRHSFVDMSQRNVTLANGSIVSTCPAALGYSFAAGTTDGPGDFDFKQGTNTSNPFWNLIGGFLSVPTDEQVRCQAPKPILLNTGGVSLPYLWDPASVPVSVFRVGNLLVLNVPAEFTTMAGRRLRKAVRATAIENGVKEPIVTIAGLSNSYTHYVTTFEEYGGQRYEAASTLYGPHTLAAYIQEIQRLTKDMLDGLPSVSDNPPDDLSKRQLSFLPPVELDTIGIGKKFGSVSRQPNDEYVVGTESVLVTFRSANPRNNQRIEDTFLTIDSLGEDGVWKTLYVDGDWCTRFVWKPEGIGASFVDIHWKIPPSSPQGLYRICHYGTRKTFLGDASQLLVHVPDWVLTSSLGSIAMSLSAHAARTVLSLSHTLHHRLGISVSRIRYRDFSGCSKSFLVHHESR